ncbi:MAG: phosphoribosylanthranilate isomerase [Lautropia sp.]
MRTRVKYCGLVRPNDVDAAVSIGADAVGFVFYPKSPRLLEAAVAADLRRRLPSWVVSVGLFVNADPREIGEIRRQVGLDVIQLHGDETPADARALQAAWWKALRIPALPGQSGGGSEGGSGSVGGTAADPVRRAIAASMERYRDAELCLLDSLSPGYGGSGKTFDWSLIPPEAGRRLIMSGGLDELNVAAAIESIAPFAVDTSSGIQGQNPREKDVGRMEQFMEAVRLADGRRKPHQQ